MNLFFYTPTRLSLLDLTTMGDSGKRDDPTKIGKFSSGLKYAMALFLRNDVYMSIEVIGDETGFSDHGDIHYTYSDHYSFFTQVEECDSTGKRKEIIAIEYEKVYESFALEGSKDIEEVYTTGFAKNLGYNWELWMGFRELVSNCFDEDGYITETQDPHKRGTCIKLEFEENSPFHEVWKDRDKYVNSKLPLYTIGNYEFNQFDILDNPEGYLKIYKRNILVHCDEKVPSVFAYNIKFGEIDERRVLSNVYNVQNTIRNGLKSSNHRGFYEHILASDFVVDYKDFCNGTDSYESKASDLLSELVHQLPENNKTFSWIRESVNKRPDSKLPGRKINSLSDHVWSAKKEVTIQEVLVQDIPKEVSLKEQILSKYNLDLSNIEFRHSKMQGNVVSADTFNNCLVISPDFNLDEHMSNFIVEYFILTSKKNIIDSLSNHIVKLITK